MFHQPVLFKEVIEYLSPQPGETVVDGTIGLGGHSEMLLTKIQPDGKLIGIDLDNESLLKTQERLNPDNRQRVSLFCDNFANTGDILERLGVKADIIFLDLGISSYQLDSDSRGFSFMKDVPLDMRMCRSNPLDAAAVVNQYTTDDLIKIFKTYGEERCARRIAQKIITRREKEPIKTTFQLVEIIKNAAPCGWQRIHPATRVFQALRIEVNKELDNLNRFLEKVTDWLNPGGRIGIISFHSLEDRLVKQAFRNYRKEGILEITTKKPVVPTMEERNQNPRSRSAKFRVAVKK